MDSLSKYHPNLSASMAVTYCRTDICEYFICLFIKFHMISIKALKTSLNHYVLCRLMHDSAAALCLMQGKRNTKLRGPNFVLVSDLLCYFMLHLLCESPTMHSREEHLLHCYLTKKKHSEIRSIHKHSQSSAAPLLKAADHYINV